MDLTSRNDVFSATVDKLEVDGWEYWHLEVLEDDELVFDFNGNLEECLGADRNVSLFERAPPRR